MELLNKWHCTSYMRYELTSVVKLTNLTHVTKKLTIKQHTNKVLTKAYLNHSCLWTAIDYVTLHASSKKLVSNNEHYGVFNLALTCFGNQTPQMIKSKKSIAVYKVMKGALSGTNVQLRKTKQRNFLYKMCFLAPELENITFAANVIATQTSTVNSGLGINNVFIWPELDGFDYTALSQMPGLDVTFYYKNFFTYSVKKHTLIACNAKIKRKLN